MNRLAIIGTSHTKGGYKQGQHPNKFTGWCADIHKGYWASDVTVFPSFREGFGNVCVESILCGAPIVSYDVVGCRESVKQGISGYMVPLRDTNAMVQKIINLFEDNDQRDMMVAKGSEWAKKSFNQEIIWNGILKIYSNLVSEVKSKDPI